MFDLILYCLLTKDTTFQEAVAELSSQVKKKSHALGEAARKVGDMRQTLDCTWTIVQKTGSGLGAPR